MLRRAYQVGGPIPAVGAMTRHLRPTLSVLEVVPASKSGPIRIQPKHVVRARRVQQRFADATEYATAGSSSQDTLT